MHIQSALVYSLFFIFHNINIIFITYYYHYHIYKLEEGKTLARY